MHAVRGTLRTNNAAGVVETPACLAIYRGRSYQPHRLSCVRGKETETL